MATTGFWPVKGKLNDVLTYIENPEKTTDLNAALEYATDPTKTDRQMFVSGINCSRYTAYQDMVAIKQNYGERGQNTAYHGYQSFVAGEVTPQEAHAIGMETARRMWGERFQIIVTTHLDKDHLHNHFCFNSVSYRDGKKYDYSKSERRKMMEISDRLCREHGLSVIEHPHKAPSRPVWLAEKRGEDTLYNIYRRDIVDAVNNSKSVDGFRKYLIRLGYDVDLTRKHWRIKMPGREHYTRMDTLGDKFTADIITDHIMHARGRFADKPYAIVSYPPEMPYEYRQKGMIEKLIEGTDIYRLYLYYCYQLGILPEKTEYRPTSPILKEDIRKMDEISDQARYMGRNNISTIEDLLSDREKLSSEINDLIEERKKIYNKIRRAKPEDIPDLRAKRDEVSTKLETLRKDLKCNHRIEERSVVIKNKLQAVYENELKHSLSDRNRSRSTEERSER